MIGGLKGETMKNITVIGGGAWGTALAMTAAKAGNNVMLWAREPEIVEQINVTHKTNFLPNAILSEKIVATNNMQQSLEKTDIVLLVAPAQYTRSVFEQMMPFIDNKTTIVLCAKGIELKTGKLLSEVIYELMPDAKLAVLSGPGFAAEVANEKPTAVTIGANDIAVAEMIAAALKCDYFRPYSSADLITPQVCGSVKNVLAIAAGISDGCDLGDNGRAALITRGLAEMSRFAEALGGRRESVLGLCGIGDLVLTASSTQSRNYSFGHKVGVLKNAKEVLNSLSQTVEGLATADSVLGRAKELGVEMPICQAVFNVVYAEQSIDAVLRKLLDRPLREEA